MGFGFQQCTGLPQVIGHRGARAVLPENILPAFVHALECGADGLELDVAVTRDDQVVVTHDLIVNRRVVSAPVAERIIRFRTWDEVQAWDCGSRTHPLFRKQRPVPGARMPLLRQVLSLRASSSAVFYIELKSDPLRPWLTPPRARYAELVVREVREAGVAGRCVLMSFNHRLLRQLAEAAPEIRRARLFAFGVASFGAKVRRCAASIAAPHYSLVTRRKVEYAHAAGIGVVAWTANRQAVWRRLVAAAVDAIITDDPGGLRTFLQGL